MIKNILSNKSGNPESLKKKSKQLESSSTNARTIVPWLLLVLQADFHGSNHSGRRENWRPKN